MKKNIKTAAGFIFQRLLSMNVFKGLKIIIMYHRVCGRMPEGPHDPAMFVTADSLDMHLRELKQYFDIVSLERAIESPGEKERFCAITFDDGWADNYEHAFPVLKKHEVPATVFIPFEVIGSKSGYWFQNIWDLASQVSTNGKSADFLRYFSEHASSWRPQGFGQEQIIGLIRELKSLPAEKLDYIISKAYGDLGIKRPTDQQVMTWEQIRAMGREGVTFGSHGLHHYILPCLNHGAKSQEVIDSLHFLKRANVAISPFFSYPNGNWDDETQSLVEKAGYKGAVTTQLGHNVSLTNPYLLKRIAMHDEISNTVSLLWFRILQAAISRDAY
jgi:peptidoglycan/xylan/chitin deacetylase (PgdA/CDA1 family)